MLYLLLFLYTMDKEKLHNGQRKTILVTEILETQKKELALKGIAISFS